MAGRAPGAVAAAMDKAFPHAQTCGCFKKFETRLEAVPDGGIDFQVHVASALRSKPQVLGAAAPKAAPKRNPFLPPFEDGLHIGPAGDGHVLLFNKFPVVDRHSLLVTKEFQPQSSPLTAEDLAALWPAVCELGAVGFYNCGLLSGASQPHKHMQIVPLEDGKAAVHEVLHRAGATCKGGESFRIPHFAFRHACRTLAEATRDAMPAAIHRHYLEMMAELELPLPEPEALAPDADPSLLPSYNFLLTETWMMVVPRGADKCERIGINSVGFCGSILVKSDEDLQRVRDLGPLAILAHVATPLAGGAV